MDLSELDLEVKQQTEEADVVAELIRNCVVFPNLLNQITNNYIGLLLSKR